MKKFLKLVLVVVNVLWYSLVVNLAWNFLSELLDFMHPIGFLESFVLLVTLVLIARLREEGVTYFINTRIMGNESTCDDCPYNVCGKCSNDGGDGEGNCCCISE